MHEDVITKAVSAPKMRDIRVAFRIFNPRRLRTVEPAHKIVAEPISRKLVPVPTCDTSLLEIRTMHEDELAGDFRF